MKTTNIEELLDELTLEEQVSLLTGADFWTTVPIPRASRGVTISFHHGDCLPFIGQIVCNRITAIGF
jgi:hypothetical protein